MHLSTSKKNDFLPFSFTNLEFEKKIIHHLNKKAQWWDKT